MIEIFQRHLKRIHQHAGECYPNECCGILVGRTGERKRVIKIIETENVEITRGRDRYVLDGKDFLKADNIAKREGLEIIGFYHSHPGYPPVPSSTDRELAWQGYSYLIVSLQDGEDPEFRCWILNEVGKSWFEEKIVEIENPERADQ